MPSSFCALPAFGRRIAFPIEPGAFRFFLAMLVFVHHFSRVALGGYAVFVFFVLSGYWVQRMWVERYAITRSPYLTYMTSRLWRLAPVMVLVSIAAYVAFRLFGIGDPSSWSDAQGGHLIFSTLFFVGYSWLGTMPVGSAWSLDVEMQFYLLAPLLSVLLAFAKMRFAILILSLALLLYFTEGLTVGGFTHFQHVGRFLAFFLVGMVSARLDWHPSARLALASAALVVGAVVSLALSPYRGILFGGANPGPLFIYNFSMNVTLAALTIPFAIYTTTRNSDPTDRMLADLSYIVYLLHWIATLWFQSVAGPIGERLTVAGASFAGVPLLSWLIWKFYDHPLNRLRSRWVASRAPQRGSTTTLAEPAAP